VVLPLVILDHVIDMTDIPMIETTGGLGGGEKLLDGLRIGGQPLGEDLDRVPPAHLGVFGQIQPARGRGAELVEQLVLADDQAPVAAEQLLGLPAGERPIFDQIARQEFWLRRPGGHFAHARHRGCGKQAALFDRADQRLDAGHRRWRRHSCPANRMLQNPA
jgi:hypothetical protein